MSNIDDFFSSGGSGGGHGQPVMPASKIGPNGRPSIATGWGMFSFSTGNTHFSSPTDSDAVSSTMLLSDSTGTAFSVSLTNINSSLTLTLTYWAGMYWYDNVDLLFYALVVDDTTANTIYLITVSKTGTIALVGSDTIANWASGTAPSKSGQNNFWVRAAQGSGDFTISLGATRDRTVISSADGTVQSTDVDFNLTGGTDTTEFASGYITRDGRVTIGAADVELIGNSGESALNTFSIQRKNAAGLINMQQTMPNLLGNTSGASFWDQAKFIEWDGGVILTATATATAFASGSGVVGVRQWEVAAFDAWLHEMCDYLGLAEET